MWLTISSEGHQGVPMEVGPGRHVLGRAPDSDIVLDDPYISLHHVAIEVGETDAVVIDLRSTNGTYVDGHRLEHPLQVSPPANLRLGDTWISLLSSVPDAARQRIAPADALRPPPPPPVQVASAGPVASRDVMISGGRDAAGRDLIIHKGLTLKSKMRSSAKACIQWGCVSFLLGTAMVGYFVITWNTEIFSLIGSPGDLGAPPPEPNLPSPLPWVPLGFALSFVGICLAVAGLLIPRDRIVTETRS